MKSLKNQILVAICVAAYCGNSISDGNNVIPRELHFTEPPQNHRIRDKGTDCKPITINAINHPQSEVKTFTTQWGFLGHKTINQHAVFALPQPLFGFYKKHIQFITNHAVDPDQRRYSDTAEACRHYIDLDHYEKALPIDTLPKYWMQAVEKITADTLFEYGIVPYHVQMMLYRLTKAFQEKTWPPSFGCRPTSATTWPMHTYPCTPLKTTTVNSPISTESTPSGKPASRKSACPITCCSPPTDIS